MEHKVVCATMRTARDRALADHEARGGLNQMRRDFVRWMFELPGLVNEIQLMAWAHRGESSLIHAISSSQSKADVSDIRVEIIPRSFWDEDPRFLETYCDSIRTS